MIPCSPYAVGPTPYQHVIGDPDAVRRLQSFRDPHTNDHVAVDLQGATRRTGGRLTSSAIFFLTQRT